MSVLSVVLSDRSGSMDQQFHRTYRHTYTVILSSPTDTDLSILLSGLIPLPNSSHPDDSAALAIMPEVTVPDREDPTLRQVTVEFRTRSLDPDRQNSDHSQSPVDMPPTAVWGHVVGQRLFTVTADTSAVKIIRNGDVVGDAVIPGAAIGKPIPVRNSAGEEFETAPETEERRLTLSVRMAQADYDPLVAESYFDSTNDADIILAGKTFLAGTARCVAWGGERAYAKGIAFYWHSIQLEFSDNWDLDLRDVGTYSVKNDGSYEQIAATSSVGLGSRVNLNGSGVALGITDTPCYLRFRRFPRKDFAALGLSGL